MILINLLPHREEARKKQQESFVANLIAAIIVGVIVAALGWGGLHLMEIQQDARNQYLIVQNEMLQGKIQQISQLRAQIASLQARKTAVENLQADRNLPVHWMEDLARLTPDGVYLTKAHQQGLALTINGVTLSSDRISQFLTDTGEHNNAWITNSRWGDKTAPIEAVDLVVVPNEPARRVYTFGLSFDLVRDNNNEAANHDATQ